METISNLATNATTAASKLIYGDQTQNNETAGKEPISGETGAGTATQPYDQGNLATPLATADKGTFLDYSNNATAGKEPATGSGIQDDFLKLDPVSQGPTETGATDPKIYSDRSDDPSYVGMPIMPLNPDANTLGTGAAPSATAAPGTTGITDKVWKDNPLDDISRAGAPGAGPTPPSHVTPAAPESAATTTAPDTTTHAERESENRDTPAWTDTGVASDSSKFEEAAAKQNRASPKQGENAMENETGRKSESTDLASSPSNEEKSGKMSHLKEKMKNKLHIGSKDK